jgi:hypothetical protein
VKKLYSYSSHLNLYQFQNPKFISEGRYGEYYQGDQIKEYAMGMACSTNGRDEKYNILVVKPERARTIGVDEKITLDWI